MDTFTLYFLRSDDQTAELELTYNHGEDSEYEKVKASDTSQSIQMKTKI
ncbi:hypothetical protein HRED_09787 [Candidatus Haloredivivus sp. G17]|nr:hypothetical protein HRED_09787 [Candidatus Haloredivivus sp. G17]